MVLQLADSVRGEIWEIENEVLFPIVFTLFFPRFVSFVLSSVFFSRYPSRDTALSSRLRRLPSLLSAPIVILTFPLRFHFVEAFLYLCTLYRRILENRL